MKHLNFLSSLGSQSGSHRVVTSAVTVGSPSAHRRGTMLKHVAFLLLFLFAGFGQMWGATEKITLSSFGWSNATAQSSISSSTATIALAKNSAGTTPTYYTADGLRLYGVKNGATTGGTIAFTAVDEIREIAFTHTLSNGGYLAIKTGSGSYNSSTKKWSGTLTAGNTVSLVARNASDNKNNPQVRITEICIRYLAKVTFNANGGSCATANVTQADTASTVSLPTPTRDGFTCTGWYTTVDGDTKRGNAGDSYKPTASETLFAHWESAGCANKVNITNSATTNVTNGSFTVDKTGEQNACSALSVTVTPTPATHYHVASVSATNPATTGTAGSAVDNGNGTYTITYSANAKGNTTISVTFEENTKHSVTWKVNNSPYSTGNPSSEVYDGEKIATFPTVPSSCQAGKEFVGWSATAIGQTPTNTKPTLVSPQTIVTGDLELHAVFATRTANSYTLGDVHDLVTGKNVLIVNPNSKTACSNASTATGKLTATGVTITDGTTISSMSNTALIWTIENDGVKYKFKIGNSYLRATSNANTKLAYGTTSDSWTVVPQSSNYILYSNTSTSSFDLEYYSSNFTTYTAGTGVNYQMQFFVPTYTGYFTECCTPLASINGSVNLSNISETGATATWELDGESTGISKYILKVYNASTNVAVKTIDNISASATSQAITGLTPCTEYYAKISTVASTGYCDGAEQGKSDNFTTNGWAVHYTSNNDETALLSNVTKLTGAASACLNENYVATFQANSGFVLPNEIVVYIAGDEKTVDSDYTWAISNGVGTLTIFTTNLEEEIDVRIIGELAPCDPMDAPSVTVTPTYNGASLSWDAVSHASKYKVYIYNNDDSSVESDENVTNTSYTVSATLANLTTYKYRVDAVSENESSYCSSFASSTFTTLDYPTVKLFYSENGVLSEGVNKKILTDITLPSTAAECDKQLVGWTTATNASYSDASVAPDPLYAPGKTDFQIPTNANCTLYAVYANVVEGSLSWDLVTDASSLQENDIITFTSTCQYTASKVTYKDTVAYAGKSGNYGAVVPIGITDNKIRVVKTGSIGEIKLVNGEANGKWKLYDMTDHYISGSATASKNELSYGESGSDFAITIANSSPYAATVKFGVSDSLFQYNPNSNAGTYSNARFSRYISTQKEIQIYKKSVIEASTTNYATICAGKVVKPIISGVTDGTTYESAQTITITSATPGATIKYTTDGSDPASSETTMASGSSFTLNANGDYTIRAIAVKTDMTNSDEATPVSFTLDLPYTTIASFIAAAPSTAKKLVVTDAIVLGIAGNNIYIQDATAGIQLNATSHGKTWASGKKLEGTITGTYQNNSNSAYMPRVNVTDFGTTDVTSADPALPTPVDITEGTDVNICKLVRLQNVKFQSTNLSDKTVYVEKTDQDIDTVYNTFGVLTQTLPNSATLCDVTGVLIKYSSKYEIAPVSVNGITTNGASAILPTLSTTGSTDSENPTAVAEGKSITVTPAAGMTTTLKDGDADATTITEATNVTISEDKAIVVTAQAYYYNNNTVNTATYYYHADGSLTERTISKATMSNGTVTVKNGDTEVSSAAQGATITLIPVPTFTTTQHYHLTDINIVDAEENDVELSGPTDGKYTFTMPAAAVTVSATFAEDAKYAITFDGNGNTGGTAPSAISNKYAGTEITLPACNYKKSGYSFSHWTVAETDSKNPVTVANNKFNMPAAAVTITAQWEPLPVWATTYTSNITTTANVIVIPEDAVQHDAWKVEKGSYITLDIPKGTTAIHLHMVAWKSEAANATISGTCFSSNKVISLTANDGISNNSPFTLSEAEGSDFYVSLTPDNAINANTTIRIDAASNKRLVVFGVNAIYPEITLSPTSHDFENVRANQTKTQEFTITKNANVTGTLSASIIDDDDNKYSVGSITDGKVTVTFAPGAAESGTFTAKLKIQATNASVTADLTGTAIAALAPEITVDKNAVAFGRVNPNASVHEDIQIGLLNIDGAVSAALSGDDAEKFGLSAASFTADGVLTITPNTTENGVYAATLTLSATGADNVVIPLSITVANKWATMYTSNVTVSANENKKVKVGSDATEYTAPKTNSGATATITLPKGTQKLHLHMVAWKGEGGNFTISGTCFNNDKTINVPANDVVSGTGGTYTFTEKLALSYYHEIVLDNVDNNSAMTVSVTKSGSRIVLFGVNQEGGVIEITESTNISTLGDVENQPIVASGEGVVLTVNVPTTTPSITAKDGATIKIEKATTTESINVEDSSVVTLEENVETSVFHISATQGTFSGQVIVGNNTVTATEAVFEMTFDETAVSEGWYAFTVPFPVNTETGVYNAKTNTPLVNETDYAIMTYHGAIRAQGLYGWKKYHGNMIPGVLYIITFADTEYNKIAFHMADGCSVMNGNTVTLNKYDGGAVSDGDNNGWNGIGNPTLCYATNNTTVIQGYKAQFLNHDDNVFEVSSNEIVEERYTVGSAFFVKASVNMFTSESTVSIPMEAAEYGIVHAPARAGEGTGEFLVRLGKTTDSFEDQLFVSASEDATTTYQDGHELVKMGSMGTAKVARMYVDAYGLQLCDAEFPLENQQALFPLVMTAPAAGTYHLYVERAPENANLYVTYEGAIVWNLSLGDYELDLTKGTTTGYGLLLVVQPNQMPTGIEDGESLNGENGVQKILLNGNLYILRDGHLYDAVGKQAR